MLSKEVTTDLKWWAVSLIPQPIARWLWNQRGIAWGSWSMYIFGQANDRRFVRMCESIGRKP